MANSPKHWLLAAGTTLVALASAPSCETDVELGENAFPAAAGAPDAGEFECTPTPCEGKIYACGDCVDNEGDDAIDAEDPECLGPCDRSEETLPTEIPGEGGGGCSKDCFFDGNSGQGDDGCSWDYACDPLSTPPDYPPSGSSNCEFDPELSECSAWQKAQPEQCLQTCLPLTPNGCDCFGCCELPAGSGTFVYLGSDSEQGACEMDALKDPVRCRPCTPVASCLNSCDPCELCVGKTEVPADCDDPLARCPGGETPCGATGEPRCDSSRYCLTGCCVDVVR